MLIVTIFASAVGLYALIIGIVMLSVSGSWPNSIDGQEITPYVEPTLWEFKRNGKFSHFDWEQSKDAPNEYAALVKRVYH